MAHHGQTVICQMDKLQRTASRHVLVITAYYVANPYCCYEMEQAIKYFIKPSR